MSAAKMAANFRLELTECSSFAGMDSTRTGYEEHRFWERRMGSSLGRGGPTRLHRTATRAHWRTGALVAAGLCGRKHGLTEENPIQSAGGGRGDGFAPLLFLSRWRCCRSKAVGLKAYQARMS